MNDLTWVAAGYGATASTLALYVWSLRRRHAAVRRALGEERP